MLADARPASANVLTERDKAWVDVDDEFHWLAKGQRFTWISERDGWRHVYLAPPGGGQAGHARQLRRDRSWCTSTSGTSALFPGLARQPHAAVPVRIGSAEPSSERLTPENQSGWHDYRSRPTAGGRSTRFHRPPAADRVGQIAGAQDVRVLADNEELRKRARRSCANSDASSSASRSRQASSSTAGAQAARFDPAKKYPLMIFVYGEPAGQTVFDRWGGRTLWHHMLAQQGYVVMSFDNRGTPARAVALGARPFTAKSASWHRPIKPLHCETVLAARPYLDPQRVGVWGWSGGGSTTLNAIFKYPELYATAWPLPPCPINCTTTRSTRNATWGCRATMPKLSAGLARQLRPPTARATC